MTTQNNQITEDFVSPQLAKLLAAKGFDVPTLRFYDSQDIPCVSGRNEPFNWNEFKDSRCPSFSRPTDCTPFNRINEAKSYIKRHLKDNAEIIHVRMDITYNYKTIKR